MAQKLPEKSHFGDFDPNSIDGQKLIIATVCISQQQRTKT